MRALLLTAALLIAGAPAGAQIQQQPPAAKPWELSKQLSCTITTLHNCRSEDCKTQQMTLEFRVDLVALTMCLILEGACKEPLTIAETKTFDSGLVVYTGRDKDNPLFFRIRNDGRVTGISVREIGGEGGAVFLGTCTAK